MELYNNCSEDISIGHVVGIQSSFFRPRRELKVYLEILIEF